MSISHTTWNILEECYGKDIKDRIYSGRISEGELYEICRLMDMDYRYVLMQKDDYLISSSDPVRDPRLKQESIDEKKNAAAKTGGGKASAGTPCKKEGSLEKSNQGDTSGTEQREKGKEDNRIVEERFNKMFLESGFTFEFFRRFIGLSVSNKKQMFEHKTFEKGTTATIAWMFETTPEYLEGKTNDRNANAKDVVRPIMSTQDFMVNSEAIKPYRGKIRNGIKHARADMKLNEDFVLWLTAEDRLVTRDFAENIARTAGLHVTAIRSFKKKYKSEPAIIGIADRMGIECGYEKTKDTNKPGPEKERDISNEAGAADKTTPYEKNKAKGREVNAAWATDNPDEKNNSPSEKDLFTFINSLTDEKLELIGKYVQSVRELRNLERQFN